MQTQFYDIYIFRFFPLQQSARQSSTLLFFFFFSLYLYKSHIMLLLNAIDELTRIILVSQESIFVASKSALIGFLHFVVALPALCSFMLHSYSYDCTSTYNLHINLYIYILLHITMMQSCKYGILKFRMASKFQSRWLCYIEYYRTVADGSISLLLLLVVIVHRHCALIRYVPYYCKPHTNKIVCCCSLFGRLHSTIPCSS